MKRRPEAIEEIVWQDSMSYDERWTDTPKFLAESDNECRTVGYVVAETKQFLSVASSLSVSADHHEHNGIVEVGGAIAIPKTAIIGRRVLSKGRR